MDVESGNCDPRDCPHDNACVQAYIGDDCGKPGQPWVAVQPDRHDLDGVIALVTLGVCDGCSSQVVSVRMWDEVTRTPLHWPAWTSRWTRLVRTGEPDVDRPAVS